jgi:hypothetical protein
MTNSERLFAALRVLADREQAIARALDELRTSTDDYCTAKRLFLDSCTVADAEAVGRMRSILAEREDP